ncbi:cytochrome P450 [Cyathus striatus]|nr:cytochrome P450 [Cyathus striatus]
MNSTTLYFFPASQIRIPLLQGHPTYLFILLIIILLSLVVVALRLRAQRLANPRGLPHPPGPKPLPLLGNLFDFALENETQTYYKLAEKYGDLVFMSVLGRNVLFLNSFQTAHDLFEKRSSNYSDRIVSPMVELMGWDWSFGHMRYGDRWKIHRRMFHHQFQPAVAPVYWPTQTMEAHELLRRLLHTPNDLVEHLRHNAASLIMSVIYGITVAPESDKYLSIAEKALEGMAEAAKPGNFLVDIIPILKYVPEWIPGAGFQKKAREWRHAVHEMRDAPFEYVRNAFRQGTAKPSFVSNLLSDFEGKGNVTKDLDTIKGCAGLAYAAGAESTMSSLHSFILAIMLHPEVQEKAQTELDNVVGSGRLPEFSDRPFLPYISAITKEVLRWNPIAPLGLPHMATHDDEYNGYFIPAGTMIVGNSWRILHDPENFPNPATFNPDRFMNKPDSGQQFSPTDPLSVMFGYGRRMCPGRYTAEAQVWISIASILSAFDIRPALDEKGMPIKVEPKFTSGMICHPVPFKFSITPRNDAAEELVKQTADML